MSEKVRERIVAGAYRTVIDDGYEAASIKSIAEEAAVTPGLVHYYFKSKNDLLADAIRYGCKQWRPEPSDGATQELLAVFEAVKVCTPSCQDFYRLLFGTSGVGLHNPSIAQAVRDLIREERAYVEGLVRAHLAPRGLDQDETAAIAAAVWGSLNSISFQSLMDPDFDIGTAIDALAWLVGISQPPSLGQTRPVNQQQEGGAS
ncbi:MAG: TetR/AcrR family transcriptional regulator [Chloroflexi bacterium]|nr:TetR/AcrR family transcriptional regulator [Chloroflexota bacterium]MCI0576009.1 TetR/AcrR family transcriptional regulator [Chloroflexota bacterium]MCI0645133.1 TetR/AcrR family transcriptional regulator [Chloroflexota bacterium]MCI0726784.1 TetR/AcrR family transcriptional regulator [Chloroflexota bacterium]